MVEKLTFNQWVTGSNPVRLTTKINDLVVRSPLGSSIVHFLPTIVKRFLNALGPKIMTDKQHRIQALIHSIVTYLQDHGVGMYGVDLTLDRLKGMGLSDEKLIDLPPQGTRHDEVLKNAIAGIDAPELRDIKPVSYTHVTLPTN